MQKNESTNNKKWVGLWLDYRRALIVTLGDKKGVSSLVTTILSDVHSKHKTTGGVKSGSPFYSRSMAGHLHMYEKFGVEVMAYFNSIDKLIFGAHALCIFGPGRAKTDYQNHLEKLKSLSIGSIEVFRCAKMSERQFVAKVKDFYKCTPKIMHEEGV